MENIKELITYLTNNGGKPDNMSWYKVGKMFGIQPPDQERAFNDKRYKHESIRKKTKSYWLTHLKRADSDYKLFSFTKDKNGEIVSEKFKKDYKPLGVDESGLVIDKISKSNLGIEWVTYRNIPNEKALIEQFQNAVEKSGHFLYHKKEVTTGKNILLVYTSDKHYGAYVDESVSIYKQKEKDIPLMNRVFDSISEIMKYNCCSFDEIYIFDLGDALDGMNGKTTRGLKNPNSHTLPQDKDNIGQFEIYIKEHIDFFGNLYNSGYAKKYYYIGMANSNHGGDFDYMAFKALEIYLNAHMPDISTYISKKFVDHIIIGEHAVVFTHGSDKENTKKPNPLIPNKDTINFYVDYIINNSLIGKNVTVVGGDLHQSSMILTQRFRYRKVLSQFGESMWMQNNFGHNKPGISFDILDKNSRFIMAHDSVFEYEIKNTGVDFVK